MDYRPLRLTSNGYPIFSFRRGNEKQKSDIRYVLPPDVWDRLEQHWYKNGNAVKCYQSEHIAMTDLQNALSACTAPTVPDNTKERLIKTLTEFTYESICGRGVRNLGEHHVHALVVALTPFIEQEKKMAVREHLLNSGGKYYENKSVAG